jgi:hypothetical protein
MRLLSSGPFRLTVCVEVTAAQGSTCSSKPHLPLLSWKLTRDDTCSEAGSKALAVGSTLFTLSFKLSTAYGGERLSRRCH